MDKLIKRPIWGKIIVSEIKRNNVQIGRDEMKSRMTNKKSSEKVVKAKV